MKTISKNKLLAAIAGVGIVMSSTSNATYNRDVFIDQADKYLDIWAVEAASYGQYETHGRYFDRLLRGRTDSLEIYLEAGVGYRIVGGCDEDCIDMDFELFDSNGNQIDYDFLSDDIPEVQVTPKWSDTFILKVSIPDCRAYRCTYGVGVFGG